jgi:hypothetical protein
MSLDGFECKSMPATAFKELVRRTFGLKLSPKEAGAIVRHFAVAAGGAKVFILLNCMSIYI